MKQEYKQRTRHRKGGDDQPDDMPTGVSHETSKVTSEADAVLAKIDKEI